MKTKTRTYAVQSLLYFDLDAESFEDAVCQALEIQRDPASIATCFIVIDENDKRQEIDLGCV